MEKKLIEYQKKWLNKQLETENLLEGYTQCCRDILQIIDVAEAMYDEQKPRRRRKKTSTSTENENNPDKAWRCKAGHYFDYPKHSGKDKNLCPTCLTKEIEQNPNFKE